nr:hypothetical protein [bacterium]
NQYLEKTVKFDKSQTAAEISIDENDLFYSSIKNAYQEYLRLPEDFICGFNDTGLLNSNFYKYYYENFQNLICDYENFSGSRTQKTAKLFLFKSDNYVVWSSPPSKHYGETIAGTRTPITVCFSNKMKTDIAFDSWFHISPNVIDPLNPPVIIWNTEKTKAVINLNQLTDFPPNSNITVSIDSNLLNSFNQPVEPYQWTFKTGASQTINCKNFMVFPSNSKYVFFIPWEYIPWYKFYGLYNLTDSGSSSAGNKISLFYNSSNQIEFLKKSGGFYISKFYNENTTIDFPVPVKLFSNTGSIGEKFISNYNGLVFESQITGFYNNVKNLENFGNVIIVELKIPPSISNGNQYIYLYFSEYNGLIQFSIPGNQTKFAKKILKTPDIIFPFDNDALNKNSLKFAFNRNDYSEIVRFQISSDTEFSLKKMNYDTIVLFSNIEINLPGLYSDSVYYYRLTSIYELTNPDINSGWSDLRKFTLDDYEIKIISTPPATGFKGFSYKYSANCDASGNVLYSLSKFPSGMKINPLTGYVNWNIPATENSDSVSFSVACFNIDKGVYSNQSADINIADGRMAGFWQNQDYSLYLYSDCSFRFIEPQTPETTGSFNIAGDTISLFPEQQGSGLNAKLLTNCRIHDNKLIFNYSGVEISLSKNGVLY